MGNTHLHMVGYTLDMMEEPQAGIEHEENFDLHMLKKRNGNGYFVEALVLKHKWSQYNLKRIFKLAQTSLLGLNLSS